MKNPLRLVDKRALVILLGGFALLTLVAVISIVVSVSARDRRELVAAEERRRRETQALASSTSFGMEDFYLDSRIPGSESTYPVREPRESWSEEEVRSYWIDPSEAGLDTLEEDNDARIFRMLGAESGDGPEDP